MKNLFAVAREMDAYAGAAGDIHPPVGMIATPVRLFVELRPALKCATTLWLLWQVMDEGTWMSFQGVFSSRELAVAAARDETYWMAPMALDELLPHEIVPWPEGSCYPLLEAR